MTEPQQAVRLGSGCGIQGCLFGAVAIFVILLVGMFVIGIFRFSKPPQGMRPVGLHPAAVHPGASGEVRSAKGAHLALRTSHFALPGEAAHA